MYMTDFHTSRHIIQKIWISIAPVKELKLILNSKSNFIKSINRTIWELKKQEARYYSCLLLIIIYTIKSI